LTGPLDRGPVFDPTGRLGFDQRKNGRSQIVSQSPEDEHNLEIQTFQTVHRGPSPMSTPIENAAVTPEASKKQYDTPYLPRGQWFKKMRQEGLLQPRQPKAKAENAPAKKAPAKKVPAKTTAPKATSSEKPVRSEAQLRAIRGYYARKRQA
jgi:hypothetical protein